MIRGSIVPAVLVIVALCQLVMVQTLGLSSWRCGGFGMYGGFHPRHNELWVFESGNMIGDRYAKDELVETSTQRHLRDCLTFVNQDFATQRLEKIADERELAIQVWQLDFDPWKMTLSRKLRLSVKEAGKDE